ncbi:MAG: DNA repair protein RecO [Chloroflexi bacterium]|nr:DNA repair protein RecO [Chloroflexota bacterium]
MSSSKTYRTEGVVLRRSDSGEADRIITFLTPDKGKIHAVARGVRKPKSKLYGLVELFTHSSLMLAQGHSLDIVAQGETIHTFLPLKSDLQRSACAFYVAELVNRFTLEHEENRALFDLLIHTLEQLCCEKNVSLLLRHFEVNLLQCLGYRPNLHRCVECNALLQPVTNAFSPAGGGILCPGCVKTDQMARPISVDAIKVLRVLQGFDFATASRVRIKQGLAQEVEQVLRSYIEFLLEHKVQSAAWLDTLKGGDLASPSPSYPVTSAS